MQNHGMAHRVNSSEWHVHQARMREALKPWQRACCICTAAQCCKQAITAHDPQMQSGF